jgi:hypothetical protein
MTFCTSLKPFFICINATLLLMLNITTFQYWMLTFGVEVYILSINVTYHPILSEPDPLQSNMDRRICSLWLEFFIF